MTARQARRYVEAFNRAALDGTRKMWAVALPVTVRYDGDPQSGEPIQENAARKKNPPPACQVSAGNGLTPRVST